MNTKQVISDMMKENTGKHFLDSGSAYGRNWEYNQLREFENESRSILSFKYGYVDYTINLFHFLTENLEYYPELDQAYSEYDSQFPDDSYLSTMESFVDSLIDQGYKVNSYLGQPFTVNTYNGEDNLSQVIQYLVFNYQGQMCCLLQIHGGCDVRGGYTKPRGFIILEEMFFCNAMGDIFCNGCNASWYTDDSCTWYVNNGNVNELQEYKLIDIDDYINENHPGSTQSEILHLLKIGGIDTVKRIENQLNLIPGIDKPILYQVKDKIILDDNTMLYDKESGIGYCPNCFTELESY